MKRKLIIVVIVMLIALVTAFPAFADDRGPCNNSGGPGHSDYAKHRIVSLAKERDVGQRRAHTGLAPRLLEMPGRTRLAS